MPFVQANLIASGSDEPPQSNDGGRCCAPRACGQTSRCRCFLIPVRPITAGYGVCPTISPGSERSTTTSTDIAAFSDIQETRPRRLCELEATCRSDAIAPTVLMMADAVGGVWSYALGLCAALPEVRFVLATLGPRPRPMQHAAVSRLANVILVESDFPLEWMAAGQTDIDASRLWLEALAPEALSQCRACQWLCPGTARHPMPGHRGRPFRRAELVEGGAWHRGPAEWCGYRRQVVGGLRAADRVVAPTRAVQARSAAAIWIAIVECPNHSQRN